MRRTVDQTPAVRQSPIDRRRGFTLIELMVVLVIFGLIVGATVLRMNGISQRGRLRSAMRQCAAFDRLARTQALTSGAARRLNFAAGENGCALQWIEQREGSMDWSSEVLLRWASGVELQRVLVVGANPASDEGVVRVRVHTDGSSASYLVELTAGKLVTAVAIEGSTGAIWYHEGSDSGGLEEFTREFVDR